MGYNATAFLSWSRGATQIGGNFPVIGNATTGCNELVPAAQAGTLTTRTSNTAGVLTFGAPPGFNVGDVIGVFWGNTGSESYQVAGVVSAVSGNTVTYSGGVGTALPVITTAVIVCKRFVAAIASFAVAGLNGYVLNVTSDMVVTDGVPAFTIYLAPAAPLGATQVWATSAPTAGTLASATNVTVLHLYNGGLAANTVQFDALLAG